MTYYQSIIRDVIGIVKRKNSIYNSILGTLIYYLSSIRDLLYYYCYLFIIIIYSPPPETIATCVLGFKKIEKQIIKQTN